MAEDSEKEKSPTDSFSEKDLSEKERSQFQFVKGRIQQLQKSRQNHYGNNLDVIWSQADRDYVPHRLKAKGKKAIATDEDKGWRSATVELGTTDWQSDISQSNPFVKIQTALAILVDQNPSGVFTPISKKYEATSHIIKQLYERSWEYAKSRQQLKLFIFNLAKYGWAVGRSYPLKIERTVKVLKEYDADDPEKSVYEEKKVVEFNDIMRENLDPRNVWIDNMARPSNLRSINDWTWRKVYDYDLFKEEFGKYKLVKENKVPPGGNTSDVVDVKENAGTSQKESENQSKKLIEVFFYENKSKDLFMAVANNVPFMIEALPVADVKGLKRLSLWQTYWNLRHAESPYGVGIYEAIRFDQAMLDRIRNMTVDQLTLSIYKMFFFQGTQSLTETGDIKITPGVGKQVLDPKNLTWLEIPGPGKDAFMGIDMFRRDVDEASGITDPLLGAVTGKTAFEIAQAKESALKRLKNPLENITEALNDEALTTIALMQLLYSIPETYEIADKNLIDAYIKETGGDPALYERQAQKDENGEPMVDEFGVAQETFVAKVYPEFPMNLDKDEQGNLVEGNDTKFFRIKPGTLAWDGVVNIKAQSLLTPSKQVDKALDLEMFSTLIPLVQTMGQERMMLAQAGGQPPPMEELSTGKIAKEIVKLYDKDPFDIFPDAWLQEAPQAPPPLFVGADGQGAPPGAPGAVPPGAPQGAPVAPGAPTAPAAATQQPTSMVGKIISKMTQPFR